MMLLCWAFWNPGASTVTVYVPGLIAGRVYAPALVVTVSYETPVAVLVMVTFALGTAAPVASMMLPVMVPRSRWASARLLTSNTDNNSQRLRPRGIDTPYKLRYRFLTAELGSKVSHVSVYFKRILRTLVVDPVL